MSYTMTLDMPAKTAAWFEETSRTMSPGELGALFVAFLRERMAEKERKTPPTLLDVCRTCPVDVDFDALIPPRSNRVGRAHPVDFAKLFSDES